MNGAREKKAYYCPSCRCAVESHEQYCPECETGKPPLGWPEDLYVGRIVGGKYRIDRRISSGGFGIVFLATHLHQDVEIGKVIIKMLHPEHCFEPTIKKRFINEARAARTINNPHVVKVFDLDFDKEMVPYMIQEYVQGDTLEGVLCRERKIDLPRAVSIAMQIAEGMKESHDKGILHRDLKPENIILQDMGKSIFVKLIDFGIARFQTQSSLATASFIGTPRYMSPEQIQGKEIDKRADIFSLGVVIFETLTGVPPIEIEESEIEYLHRNVVSAPRKLIEVDPSMPEALSTLVDAMLRKDPAGRPGDMEIVMEELARLAEHQGWKADHTGSYQVAESRETEETVPDAGRSINEKSMEIMTRGEGKKHSGRLARVLLAGGVLSAAVFLAALAYIVFSNGGASRAPGPQPGPRATAAAPSSKPALTRDAGEAGDALDADEKIADIDGVEEPRPAAPTHKKKKKTKKRSPWTKI